MADAVEFSITGLDELNAKLQSISDDLKKKGGRFALRKAAMVVAKAAAENAARVDNPKTHQRIYANVTLRWSSRRYKSTGDLGFRVGVLGGARRVAKITGEFKGKGAGNPGGDTWYWRLVEFGTEHSKARPFMRPALENNTDKATNEFILQYGKAIDRAIKRAGKRGIRTSR